MQQYTYLTIILNIDTKGEYFNQKVLVHAFRLFRALYLEKSVMASGQKSANNI